MLKLDSLTRIFVFKPKSGRTLIFQLNTRQMNKLNDVINFLFLYQCFYRPCLRTFRCENIIAFPRALSIADLTERKKNRKLPLGP